MIGIIDSSIKTVTSNTILELDASHKKSYPGTGTTWFDMSGRQKNATLYNSPAINSTKGTIIFDGNNNYADVDTTVITADMTGSFTIEFWVIKRRSNIWQRLLDIKKGSTNLFITTNWGIGNGLVFDNPSRSSAIDWNGNGFYDNQWKHLVHTYDAATSTIAYYNNSVQVTGSMVMDNPWTKTLSLLNNPLNFIIARSNYSDPYLKGEIGRIAIHDKCLTATEVGKNYNALKSRFI